MFHLVLESHDGRAPGADSEEKHEPVSDIDTVVVDSLKALDPEWPIREAAVSFRCSGFATGSGSAITLALTTFPPLIVKTRTLSEAFGVITISPALAAPTVTSSAATTAASDFISGLSIKF